jgi:hypothetical protein
MTINLYFFFSSYHFETGDPEDRTLRVLENELISKRMREESRKLCVDEVKGMIIEFQFFLLLLVLFTSQLLLNHISVSYFKDNKE